MCYDLSTFHWHAIIILITEYSNTGLFCIIIIVKLNIYSCKIKKIYVEKVKMLEIKSTLKSPIFL